MTALFVLGHLQGPTQTPGVETCWPHHCFKWNDNFIMLAETSHFKYKNKNKKQKAKSKRQAKPNHHHHHQQQKRCLTQKQQQQQQQNSFSSERVNKTTGRVAFVTFRQVNTTTHSLILPMIIVSYL